MFPAIFTALLLRQFLVVVAQKEDQPRSFIHPLTNMPNAANDVKTSYFFPKHTDQKFPIGETVTVLCHIYNDGQFSYNITAIMGSLNSPYDFNFHIQNYSYKPFGIVVKAGEEYTFDYQFQLHQNLEPVEYALAHTVFYEDDSSGFSSTFFNQTVELYYPHDEYDFETLGQLLFALASTLFIAVLTYYGCSNEPNLRAIDTLTRWAFKGQTSKEEEEEEWTAAHLKTTDKRRTAKK